MQDRLTPKEHH